MGLSFGSVLCTRGFLKNCVKHINIYIVVMFTHVTSGYQFYDQRKWVINKTLIGHRYHSAKHKLYAG